VKFFRRNTNILLLTACVLLISLFLFFSNNGNSTSSKFSVANTYPHDTGAFTQGLVYKDGYIYEGTGLHGNSSLRKVELKSGKLVNKTDLPQKYFGEGITILKDKIYQLTWKSGTGFIYDLKSLEKMVDSAEEIPYTPY